MKTIPWISSLLLLFCWLYYFSSLFFLGFLDSFLAGVEPGGVCVFIQRAAAGAVMMGDIPAACTRQSHPLFIAFSSLSPLDQGEEGQKTINTISYRRYIDLVLSVSIRAGRPPPRLPRSSIYITATHIQQAAGNQRNTLKIRCLESQKRRASFPLKVNQATSDH